MFYFILFYFNWISIIFLLGFSLIFKLIFVLACFSLFCNFFLIFLVLLFAVLVKILKQNEDQEQLEKQRDFRNYSEMKQWNFRYHSEFSLCSKNLYGLSPH